MSSLNISYLGSEFSYHHLAAKAYFSGAHIFVGKTSFDEIIEAVENESSDYALMAVENSVGGDVPGNYERIAKGDVWVCAEISIKVNLHLAAINEVKFNDIVTVYSHFMAWKETSDFFSKYPDIKFIETTSTANAAKKISDEKLRASAALASKTAIGHYRLNIIKSGIDNNTENITRFFVITKKNRHLHQIISAPFVSSILLKPKKKDSHGEMTGVIKKRILSGGDMYVEMPFDNESDYKYKLPVLSKAYVNISVCGIYKHGKIISGF